MSDLLIVGIDVGTTSVKAAVLDLSGREVAHGRAPVPWITVPTGAEIAASDLLASAVLAAERALKGAPQGQVAGVGVASMAETGVLLDRRGDPVARSIAWHDSRGAEQVQRLEDTIGTDHFARRTGLKISALPSIAKYGWMREHWAQASSGVRWLSVAEWIVRQLGGEEVAELSLASRAGWFDLHMRAWWDEALESVAAPAGLLPDPQLSGTAAGQVRGSVLERTEGAVLSIGGHDHLSAARGAGAVGDGDALDSCGTAEAFVRALPPLSPDDAERAVRTGLSVGWHVVDGMQALLGSTRSGAALQRILALLGVSPEARDGLELAVAEGPEDAGGLELLDPDGERMTLAGIGREPSPALAYRAALEAGARSGAELLVAMAEVAGPVRRLVVTGGWSEGLGARAVKARHLGPFIHEPSPYTGARGAALGAGRAAGLDIDERPLPVGVATDREGR
ncbi:MAG: FGGY-family carbohydrate kinase [Solirubrobacteraceae bacterium]